MFEVRDGDGRCPHNHKTWSAASQCMTLRLRKAIKAGARYEGTIEPYGTRVTFTPDKGGK